MEYQKDNDENTFSTSEDIEKKIKEKIPGISLKDVNEEDVKSALMNEIDKNPNISQEIKDKVNKGDMDGLKQELIKHLGNQDKSNISNKKVINMLENNDFEGLQNELTSMFFKGFTEQKKNEVTDLTIKKVESNTEKGPFSGIFDEAFLRTIMGKFSEGNGNDNRIVLLNSIKPFLSDSRKKAIDESIKALNLLVTMERLGIKVGK